MGVFVGALRGTAPTLAEEALGRISFRAVREGVGVGASTARSGLTPLRPGFGGPALAEEALGRISFRAVREGLECSPPRLAPARSRCRRCVSGLGGTK
jgi:hypothetical protein